MGEGAPPLLYLKVTCPLCTVKNDVTASDVSETEPKCSLCESALGWLCKGSAVCRYIVGLHGPHYAYTGATVPAAAAGARIRCGFCHPITSAAAPLGFRPGNSGAGFTGLDPVALKRKNEDAAWLELADCLTIVMVMHMG